MKYDIWVFLKKTIQKIQLSLKSDKNNSLIKWIRMYINDNISLTSPKKGICFKVVEKTRTHILYSITFFRKSCRLSDCVEKHCRATEDNIIRCICFACWITKATNTHYMYCFLIFHCNNGYANAPQCYIIRMLCYFEEMDYVFWKCIGCTWPQNFTPSKCVVVFTLRITFRMQLAGVFVIYLHNGIPVRRYIQ